MRLLATLAIVAVGLAGRAALDKVIVHRGGAELVALWAQFTSVAELVAGVAMAGIGTGISVLVSQTPGRERQRELLREAVRQGLRVSLPAAAIVCVLAWLFPGGAAFNGLSAALVFIGALLGAIGVLPGMLNGYWLGQQRRRRMLVLALPSACLPPLAAALAPEGWFFAVTAATLALPALVILAAGLATRAAQDAREPDARQLARYLWAGISIGVLSPASTLLARSLISSSLSWHEAGQMQALWRASEWVTGIAGGFLSVYFLPRLSAAHGTPGFMREFGRCAIGVLVPSAVALLLLYRLREPAFALLYDAATLPGPEASALFLAGTWVRLVSWVPLFALYAMRRTRAVTFGEILSLPLFAASLAVFADGMSLERAALLWLACYLVYAAFNLAAIRTQRGMEPARGGTL